MRYGSPSIPAGLEKLAGAGCGRILVLPLYPQYSTTTTESVRDAVAAACSRRPAALPVRIVDSYHDHPAYLDALASSVRRHWQAGRPRGGLLLSFHGIPQRMADAGDPYPAQCVATAKEVVARLDLEPGRWHMAYQSRFGREPWLQPYTDETLEELGKAGVKTVHVVCPGFAVDCLETLEEIAMENREGFEEAGGESLTYIPALNDGPSHVAVMKHLVESREGENDE